MCTWSAVTTLSRPWGTYGSCYESAINEYHYDPCYDLFFWAYAPSSLVAFNNDMTSVCCTAQCVAGIGVQNVFMPSACTMCVTQVWLCNAQDAARYLGCYGINICGEGTRCVYNICGTRGVGGMTFGAMYVTMIPKCDFTNTANPIYCFCNAPGPLLVVGYCTTTKCFTMCNYPMGWTDLAYCGTYCSTTNYSGAGGCGGNGMVVVEY
jgi:hypothetical protein